MRSLVIDDDYTSRVQSKSLLSEFGDVDGAPSGELGLQLFESAHAEGRPYELVLLDVDMPTLSGVAVAKKIREWEEGTGNHRCGRAAKIVMLSALSDGKSVVTSFRAGCESYVVKPLSPKKLREALNEIAVTADG